LAKLEYPEQCKSDAIEAGEIIVVGREGV